MSGRRRLAVTGATGMLGRHLVEHFHARDWDVHALVRRPRAATFAIEAGRTPPRAFRFELTGELEEGSLEGVDVLVHCAATTRSTEVAGAQGVNEVGARRLFAAARETAGAQVIFLSSTSASAEAPSQYGRDKFCIEGLLDPGCDLALRLGLVLSRAGGGLFERMVKLISGSPVVPLFGGGRQCVQPVHVRDVCLAVEAALEKDLTGTLTVADPNGLEFQSFLRRIASRLGRRVLFLPLPYGPVLLGLRVIEGLRLPFPITSENLLGLREQRLHSCAADLERLGLHLLEVEQALDLVFAASH